MNEKVSVWRKSGKYLPPILRDFHDQKDIFKTVHAMTAVEKHDYCKDVSWIAGQCYVIDIFLWFMARHGWTLQRSRMPLEFDSLDANIKARQDEETAAFASMLKRPSTDGREPQSRSS